MHPRFKHTPPRSGSLSIKRTFLPRAAARKAAAYPPGPAPITTISTLLILDIVHVLKCERSERTAEKRDVKCAAAAPSITLWSYDKEKGITYLVKKPFSFLL